MNVGRVGLYESGLKQGLIPLLFLQKDKTGKGWGRREKGFPRQIHRTRPFAATRLSPQSPTLPFKRAQTLGKWEANTERKGDLKREKSRNEARFPVKIKFYPASEDRQLCCEVKE